MYIYVAFLWIVRKGIGSKQCIEKEKLQELYVNLGARESKDWLKWSPWTRLKQEVLPVAKQIIHKDCEPLRFEGQKSELIHWALQNKYNEINKSQNWSPNSVQYWYWSALSYIMLLSLIIAASPSLHFSL